MRFYVDDCDMGQITISLSADSIKEQEVIHNTFHEMLEHAGAPASLYAEPNKMIYGITAGRDDGQVLIGPNGEPPIMTVNVFRGNKE